MHGSAPAGRSPSDAVAGRATSAASTRTGSTNGTPVVSMASRSLRRPPAWCDVTRNTDIGSAVNPHRCSCARVRPAVRARSSSAGSSVARRSSGGPNGRPAQPGPCRLGRTPPRSSGGQRRGTRRRAAAPAAGSSSGRRPAHLRRGGDGSAATNAAYPAGPWRRGQWRGTARGQGVRSRTSPSSARPSRQAWPRAAARPSGAGQRQFVGPDEASRGRDPAVAADREYIADPSYADTVAQPDGWACSTESISGPWPRSPHGRRGGSEHMEYQGAGQGRFEPTCGPGQRESTATTSRPGSGQ